VPLVTRRPADDDGAFPAVDGATGIVYLVFLLHPTPEC